LDLGWYAYTSRHCHGYESIQFSSLSLPQFIELYGTEQKCDVAWEQARWPAGFPLPSCEEQEYGPHHWQAPQALQVAGAVVNQATLTAGTHLGGNKLPLTPGFLAFYSSAKPRTGISSLALSVISCGTTEQAGCFKKQIMQAMKEA